MGLNTCTAQDFYNRNRSFYGENHEENTSAIARTRDEFGGGNWELSDLPRLE